MRGRKIKTGKRQPGQYPETREFGVNIVGRKQAEQMVKSSQPVEANIDEFDHAALTKMAGQKISAPLVAGAPAHLECVYYDHIDLPENGNGSHSVMVLGHIVGIHIDDNMVENGRVDVTAFSPFLGWAIWITPISQISMK